MRESSVFHKRTHLASPGDVPGPRVENAEIGRKVPKES
jgi:hypothetical protein